MSNRSKKPSHFVAIGASAGGLEAIETFFKHMPANSGLAFVVIQHLSPDYRSMMVELLAKHTPMRVIRAEHDMRVEANQVYLIPPKTNLTILKGKLQLTEQERHRGINLPIDIFFNSLALDQGAASIAVILSGTGSDGSRGIRGIKNANGLVLVQDDVSAKFDGMPRSAIATGLADVVQNPAEMPEQILSYIKQPFAVIKDVPDALLTDEDGMSAIFAMLKSTSRVDFTLYKPTTILRRIGRRMGLKQIAELSDYVRYLEKHPAEVSTLFQELLIGVTQFFRDKAVWEYMASDVLPRIIRSRPEGVLRLWSAGCSTGEEAYTLAILVSEVMAQTGQTRDVKVFATDIDREAVQTAGNGIFSAGIADDVPPHLLSKYFQAKDDGYVIARSIREMVVFARHNLLADPPFTNIDLVSCRNMLIYLQPELQQKAFGMFSFALNQGGTLLLGSSESIGDSLPNYDCLDQKLKVFTSKMRRPPLFHEAGPKAGQPSARGARSGAVRGGPLAPDERLLERLVDGLSASFLPLTLVVNEALEIQHLSGDSSRYFKLPSGKPTADISRMAHKDLAIPLSTGLNKVFQKHKPLVYANVLVRHEDTSERINLRLQLLPAKRGQAPLGLAIFEPVRDAKDISEGELEVFNLDGATEQRIQDLEQELQYTRENLQATVEELETSNEELQATNEELLASNEELQSTNEELQSVNEELHTVNAELINKNTELQDVSGDLDKILTSGDAAIMLLDEQLALRRYTAPVARIFGVGQDDIGRPLAQIRHSLMTTDLMEQLAQVQRSGASHFEDVKDNAGRTHMLRLIPFPTPGTRIPGVVLSLTDITSRIEAERVLRENEQRFRLMVDAIDGYAIHMLDPKGYVVSWNASAEKSTGYAKRSVLGRRFEVFYPEEARKNGLPQQAIAAALERGRWESEVWLQRQDGSLYWANDVISQLVDTDGELKGFVRITRDLTERRSAELNRLKFEVAVDQSPEGIAIVGLDGLVEYANPLFLMFNAETEETAIGQSLVAVLADELGQQQEAFAAAIQAGRGWVGNLTQVSEGGGQIIFDVTLTPLRDDKGEVTSFVVMQQDVTQQRKMEALLRQHHEELEARVAERTQELEHARQEAERLSEVKGIFLSNMSHELRTPLNAVLGLAHMLQKQDLPLDASELVSRIHGAGQLLLSLINDILDLSKIDANRLTIENEPFDLDGVLVNLATVMAENARGKNLEVVIAPPPADCFHLRGDPLRLGQVLLNLTSNAIKFTPSGSVVVRFSAIERDDDHVRMRFEVIDTGIGIEAEQQAHLFKPFIQAEASTTRRFGGTGLGLTISHRLVELMGGKLQLESTEGAGSKFWFELSLARVETARQRQEYMAAIQALVVDDNPIALEGLVATVRSLGWEVESERSGKPALERVLNTPELQGSEAVLLIDWQLPDMNGGEVVAALAKQLPPTKMPLVLVVSALATHPAGDEALTHIGAWLEKPLTPSHVFDAVSAVRSRRLGKPVPHSPQAQGQLRRLVGISLLVVDDSDINLDVARRIFGSEGATVHTAPDGQAALNWLQARPGDADLVLMDVQMPIMDGLEATRHIRANPALVDLPVIALSAGMFADQQRNAREAGMVGFIAKPFQVDAAVELIAAHVRPAIGARAITDSAGAPELPTLATDAPPVLNEVMGLGIFQQPAIYAKALGKFAEQIQRHCRDASLESGTEWAATVAVAHRMRGAAGNLGLATLMQAATNVESIPPDADATRQQQAVRHWFSAMQQALKAIAAYVDKATGAAASPVARVREVDPAQLQPLLRQMLQALAQDDPSAVEPLLAKALAQLPAASLQQLSECLDAFDFRGGEQAVRALATEHAISLENKHA